MKVLWFLVVLVHAQGQDQSTGGVIKTIMDILTKEHETTSDEKKTTAAECAESMAEMDDRKHELNGAIKTAKDAAKRNLAEKTQAEDDVAMRTAEQDKAKTTKERAESDFNLIDIERNRVSNEFEEDKAQLNANIAAIGTDADGAVGAIKAKCKGAENFMQILHDTLPKHLTSLVQQADTKGSGCEAILNMLEELRFRFQNELDQKTHEDTQSEEAFTTFSGSLEKRQEELKARIELCQTKIGEHKKSAGEATAAMEKQQNLVATYESAKTELAQNREQKVKECKEADGNFGKALQDNDKAQASLKNGKGNFMQLGSTSSQSLRMQKAMADLSREAKRLQSTVLVSVVEQAKGAEFDQIVEKLGSLANKLNKQNAEEIKAAGECNAEMQENEEARKKFTKQVLTAATEENSQISEKGIRSAKKIRNAQRIKALEEENSKKEAETAKFVNRYEETLAKRRTTKTQCEGAMEAYKDQRDADPNSLQGQIHIMLEDVVRTIDGDINHYTRAKEMDTKEKNDFVNTNDEDIESMKDENLTIETDNASAEETIKDLAAQRSTAQDSLRQMISSFDDNLKKKCVANKFDPVEQYDNRVSARQAEINALDNARQTLGGKSHDV